MDECKPLQRTRSRQFQWQLNLGLFKRSQWGWDGMTCEWFPLRDRDTTTATPAAMAVTTASVARQRDM
jgi:hypothetical protein